MGYSMKCLVVNEESHLGVQVQVTLCLPCISFYSTKTLGCLGDKGRHVAELRDDGISRIWAQSEAA